MAQYSIWYAVPYMLLLAAFYFLAYQEQRSIAAKRNRQTLHIWCGVLFLFFFGLRGFVGWDWHSYYPLFESIPSLFHLSSSEFDTSELIEPGYIIYVAFVKLFTDNYHVFIFISVLIDFLLLHKIFKRYNRNVAFAFALFIGFSLTTEINLLRNIKAILIFLLALPYIREHRILPYMALILLASMFHISAVIYIPLYFFLHRKMPRSILLLLIFCGIILFVLQIHYVTPFLQTAGSFFGGKISLISEAYLNSDLYSGSQTVSLRFIERLMSIGLVIVYYKKIISGNPNNILFVNLFIAYMLVTLYLYEASILFDRIGTLFIVSYWFIYPIILENISLRNNRRIFLGITIIYMLMIVYTHTSNGLYRYDNVVFGISDYSTRQQYFNSVSSDLRGD